MLILGRVVVLSLILWSSGCTLRAESIGIIAHRGSSLEMPENTLPGIKRAIELGCSYVEVDVRLTRDGKVVLIHDPTLDRTTTGSGKVSEHTYAYILKFDAGVKFSPTFKGTHVPLLEEAIALARGKVRLYLDLKISNPEPVIKVVRRNRFSASTYYRVDTIEMLEKLQRLDPDGQIVLHLDRHLGLADPVEKFFRRYPQVNFSLDIGDWRVNALREARLQGAKIFINILGTDDTPDNLRKALALRPSAIQTDHLQLLLDLLSCPKTR